MQHCGCSTCNNTLCAKKVPIFSFLSDEEIKKIVDMTGHNFYKKGELLCSEGEKSDTLFIINEGGVKLSKLTKDGKEQIVHIFTSGDFFGELSLFSNNETYNFDVYAISDLKVCTLTKQNMDEHHMESRDTTTSRQTTLIKSRVTHHDMLIDDVS